jgi:hypothetical protein
LDPIKREPRDNEKETVLVFLFMSDKYQKKRRRRRRRKPETGQKLMTTIMFRVLPK